MVSVFYSNVEFLINTELQFSVASLQGLSDLVEVTLSTVQKFFREFSNPLGHFKTFMLETIKGIIIT